jgi:hypothetical protein
MTFTQSTCQLEGILSHSHFDDKVVYSFHDMITDYATELNQTHAHMIAENTQAEYQCFKFDSHDVICTFRETGSSLSCNAQMHSPVLLCESLSLSLQRSYDKCFTSD